MGHPRARRREADLSLSIADLGLRDMRAALAPAPALAAPTGGRGAARAEPRDVAGPTLRCWGAALALERAVNENRLALVARPERPARPSRLEEGRPWPARITCLAGTGHCARPQMGAWPAGDAPRKVQVRALHCLRPDWSQPSPVAFSLHFPSPPRRLSLSPWPRTPTRESRTDRQPANALRAGLASSRGRASKRAIYVARRNSQALVALAGRIRSEESSRSATRSEGRLNSWQTLLKGRRSRRSPTGEPDSRALFGPTRLCAAPAARLGWGCGAVGCCCSAQSRGPPVCARRGALRAVCLSGCLAGLLVSTKCWRKAGSQSGLRRAGHLGF